MMSNWFISGSKDFEPALTHLMGPPEKRSGLNKVLMFLGLTMPLFLLSPAYATPPDTDGDGIADAYDKAPSDPRLPGVGIPAVYLQDTDNENNAPHTGSPDDDIGGTRLSNTDPKHPIELNIYVDKAKPFTSAYLSVFINDIDFAQGEWDEIFLNGYSLGLAMGEDELDYSTLFIVSNPSWVQLGNNLVEVYVNQKTDSETDWVAALKRAELVVDPVPQEAFIRTLATNKPGYDYGTQVTVDLEVDTKLTSQDVVIEGILRDAKGTVKDFDRKPLAKKWHLTGTNDEPYQWQITIPPSDNNDGVWAVTITVYDKQSFLFQDLKAVTFYVPDTGPLPPIVTDIQPSVGVTDKSNPVTINGNNFVSGPTTCTIGGLPVANLSVVNNTTISGNSDSSLAEDIQHDVSCTTDGGTHTLEGVFEVVSPFTVTESGGSTDVEEGGTNDSYTIALKAMPSEDVTVTVSLGAQLDLGKGPGQPVTLIFTPENATTPQTINVSAAEVEGNHTDTITHTSASNDPEYNNAGIAGVVVNITDNPDIDEDGIANNVDNCPLIDNANQTDTDGDGAGDACDNDDDGDAIEDSVDNCPLIANTNQTDTDGDGAGDACDNDDDGDAIEDSADNCPLIDNVNQTDTDGDGAGDACNTDDDGDGIEDSVDNCPLIDNANQTDTDGDGAGDACDNDDDGDAIEDSADNCSLIDNANQTNTDSDGAGDACDNDDDGDAIEDSVDNCPLIDNVNQIDTDGDGAGDACDNDDDGDAIKDSADNCSLIDNANQTDTDSDSIGDACDTDDDGDDIEDSVDNCPLIDNTNQTDTDGDGVGDACNTDDDGDGIEDSADNCPFINNAKQIDTDSNGAGNACDTDDDGDGIEDSADNCPLIDNAKQTDTDGGGAGDVCDIDDDGDGIEDGADNCPLIANANQIDTDNDGTGDVCDSDDDGDGTEDSADNCPLIANTNQTDTDGDGTGDACNTDDDDDGIEDSADNCPLIANTNQTDTDGDGTGDACNTDDDGDGIEDGADNCPLIANTNQTDTDGDGAGNACDTDGGCVEKELLDTMTMCPVGTVVVGITGGRGHRMMYNEPHRIRCCPPE